MHVLDFVTVVKMFTCNTIDRFTFINLGSVPEYHEVLQCTKMSRSIQKTIFWYTFFIELYHHAMVVYKDGDGFNENAPCTININIRAKIADDRAYEKLYQLGRQAITKVTFTVKARILVPQPRLHRQTR